jgi:hypothetical protein
MNKLSNYKALNNNKSLFEEAMSPDALNSLGNQLDALCRLVDFEQFRPGVSAVLRESARARSVVRCSTVF